MSHPILQILALPTSEHPSPASKPRKMLPYRATGIPDALRKHPHWLVCNRNGQPVVRTGVGNSKTNAEHWVGFDTVSRIAEAERGIWPYIVLADNTLLTVFDVDFKPRRTEGNAPETEAEFIARKQRAESALRRLREKFPIRYESRSKSGNGFHIIVRGKFDGSGGKGKGDWQDVEIYTRNHGVALTGHVVDDFDNPAEYPAEVIQAMRDEIKGNTATSGEEYITDSNRGSVRPEHARKVLDELAQLHGRPGRDIWRNISSAVFGGVGVELGIELLEEVWPEDKPGEYRTLARTLARHIPWGTLRDYGVNPDDPAEWIEHLPDDEDADDNGTTRKLSLRERAYALRFDPSAPPPPDELCMAIGDFPIAARGNLTVIQGKSKVGKSAVVSAVLGAVHRGNTEADGDTLCISWAGESTGAIIHLDTEQSPADWHGLVCRGVARSGLPEGSERLVSLPLVMFSRLERMKILEEALKYELETKGRIDLVVIDGIADLCKSPNDEAEALEVISRLMALAHKYSVAIVCILHENPSTDAGKTRGHLGSELNRKAFANLRIDKDGETSISTIYGTEMRKRDIPRDQGFCFGWDDAMKMHTFQGRAAGMKAAATVAKATEKTRAQWTAIFDFVADSGTKSDCPSLTPIEAAEAERDMGGTKKLTKEGAMKKRMQRAEALDVLKKAEGGGWILNPLGQSGQIGDI